MDSRPKCIQQFDCICNYLTSLESVCMQQHIISVDDYSMPISSQMGQHWLHYVGSKDSPGVLE